MRLLVSVRDAMEARAALAGGAEIIDAKEPAAGSLGPVAPAELASIRQAVPPEVGLSAALGDVTDLGEVESALASVLVPLDFIKVGFSGVAERGRLRSLIARAVRLAPSVPAGPTLIVVAYADWRQTGSLPPAAMAELATDAGAGGMLVDTAVKDGTTLFDLCEVDELAALGGLLVRRGGLFALGGVLNEADIPRARATGAAVFGVRTAACEGGRGGRVSAARVKRLAESTREVCERA